MGSTTYLTIHLYPLCSVGKHFFIIKSVNNKTVKPVTDSIELMRYADLLTPTIMHPHSVYKTRPNLLHRSETRLIGKSRGAIVPTSRSCVEQVEFHLVRIIPTSIETSPLIKMCSESTMFQRLRNSATHYLHSTTKL